MSGILEPMKYSQKVQTPPSGPLGCLNYSRQGHIKLFEAKAIIYLSQVCLTVSFSVFICFICVTLEQVGEQAEPFLFFMLMPQMNHKTFSIQKSI